jgi:hypothetical protein
MYAGLKYKDNQAVGDDEIKLELSCFEDDETFDIESVKNRGRELFKGDAVQFISLQGGVGKAIVCGSELYEIDFRYKDGYITYMACDCPYFAECKHEIAFLYKLRDVLGKLAEKTNAESFVLCNREVFNVIISRAKGKLTMEL